MSLDIKYTPLGMMIYGTMFAWLAAMILQLVRIFAGGAQDRGKQNPLSSASAQTPLALATDILFAVGSLLMTAAFVYRWIEVEHAPLQNMFEVFVCLGMLMWPLWLFSRKFLGARAPAINLLIGICVLFPAGFVFHAEPQRLPPALQSWLFIPHVSTYMVSYIVFALACGQAILQLCAKGGSENSLQYEAATYNMIRLALPMLTMGLILGAVWGKMAWSDYWNWDPKELWSLVTFLMYLVYFHFRSTYGVRFARINSALAILGTICVILTLLWVNLADKFSSGMHSYAR